MATVTADMTTEDMLAGLRASAATVPAGLTDWITRAGVDLVRIAVCFAGFDASTVVRALAKQRSRDERINAATVNRVLGEIADTFETSEEAP